MVIDLKTERYQLKRNIIKKYGIFKRKRKKLKAFQNIIIIFKINSIDLSFFFVFICRASRISGNLKGSLKNYIDKMCLYYLIKHA